MFIFLILMIILFSILIFFENFLISINLIMFMNLSLDFNLNIMNSIFSMIVIMISMGVLFYSKLYFLYKMSMKFKLNLMIFIMSMILLINSSSLILLMIGWDGLGISSFYLVSFYSNLNSSISSLITFFFNRLGDSLMMLFASMMMYSYMKIQMMMMNKIIFFMLFISLITKSSQIPFGVWLPMAMSAPTPISSLVHSSTLVTAGIFVLMKMNFLFFLEIQYLIMIFSMMTFILGGIFSLSILDLKKAVAFSTLSQLGFILFSMSLGNFIISFYHLIFHAFFKSSLFVNLGYFMIMNFSIQDMRMKLNNNKNLIMKLTFIISCLNLMGLISTSGFISKEMILIFFFNKFIKLIMSMMIYFGSIMTACYSMKFMIFLFFKNMKNLKMFFKNMFNMMMMWIMISSFMVIFIPNMFINLFFLEYEEIMFSFYKMEFYMIILISMFLMKIIFMKINKFMFMFSSMLMILDMNNLILYKIKLFMMMFFKKLIMIEEFFQFNIFYNFYSSININLNMKFMFMNLMLIFILMILFLIYLKNFLFTMKFNFQN